MAFAIDLGWCVGMHGQADGHGWPATYGRHGDGRRGHRKPPAPRQTPGPQPSGDVGSIPIHQLSAREYDNTVRDLLGTALAPGSVFQSFEADGFDTLAAAGVMNSAQGCRLLRSCRYACR